VVWCSLNEGPSAECERCRAAVLLPLCPGGSWCLLAALDLLCLGHGIFVLSPPFAGVDMTHDSIHHHLILACMWGTMMYFSGLVPRTLGAPPSAKRVRASAYTWSWVSPLTARCASRRLHDTYSPDTIRYSSPARPYFHTTTAQCCTYTGVCWHHQVLGKAWSFTSIYPGEHLGTIINHVTCF
jgi:hypothetical protein